MAHKFLTTTNQETTHSFTLSDRELFLFFVWLETLLAGFLMELGLVQTF
jgi:hypothetical protein